MGIIVPGDGGKHDGNFPDDKSRRLGAGFPEEIKELPPVENPVLKKYDDQKAAHAEVFDARDRLQSAQVTLRHAEDRYNKALAAAKELGVQI